MKTSSDNCRDDCRDDRRDDRGDDRRAETRQPARGDIRLRQTGAMTGPFTGHLVDASPHGFRIRHACLTLASGDHVDFEFRGRSGAARAMWTRIVGVEAETGFNILREVG